MDGGYLFFFFQFFEKQYSTYMVMHMCLFRRAIFAMFVYPHAALSYTTTTHLGQVTCDYYYFATLLHIQKFKT
jgi:hypothetical protein